jgi:hypothetical protein
MAEKTFPREAQDLEQLSTRAINALGEDIVLDAFVRAAWLDATPFAPASSAFEEAFEEKGAGIIPPDVQMTRVNLPAVMDALEAELRRMLTEH